jgi:hypothetical protein
MEEDLLEQVGEGTAWHQVSVVDLFVGGVGSELGGPIDYTFIDLALDEVRDVPA